MIRDIRTSCLSSQIGVSCDKKTVIDQIEKENSSGGSFGELNVRIDDTNKNFDIWITYNISGAILSHLDRRTVRNMTAFYYVVNCDINNLKNNEDEQCVKNNKKNYFYSPIIQWSVTDSRLSWLRNKDNYFIFHYFLSV
ncbi:hypothetical protein AAEU23_004717 [Escherichia coli]